MRALILLMMLFVPLPAMAEIAPVKDIAYGRDEMQKLDIYSPAGCSQQSKCPVVIWIHGGGWRNGNKDGRSAAALANSWVAQGIIMVNVNYRLTPKVVHPAHVQDVAAATAWVYKNIAGYGGDTRRIHLLGHSAGAHLVALVATHPDYLKANGVTAAEALRGVFPVDTASFMLNDSADGITTRLVKNAFGTDPAVLQDASPLYWAQRGGSFPNFIVSSTTRTTALKQSKALVEALNSAGTNSMLITVDYGRRRGLAAHGDIAKELMDPSSEMTSKLQAYVLRP